MKGTCRVIGLLFHMKILDFLAFVCISLMWCMIAYLVDVHVVDFPDFLFTKLCFLLFCEGLMITFSETLYCSDCVMVALIHHHLKKSSR